MTARERKKQERLLYYFWFCVAMLILPVLFGVLTMLIGSSQASVIQLGMISAQLLIFLAFALLFFRLSLPVSVFLGLVVWLLSFMLAIALNLLDDAGSAIGGGGFLTTMISYFLIPILLWEYGYRSMDRWSDTFNSLRGTHQDV